MRKWIEPVSLFLALALVSPSLSAQIEASSDSVLHGSASNCSQPATIDYQKVAKRTPEHGTIRSEGVRKDSARYSLLMAQMKKRIKAACAKVAKENGYDCVVREGDVKDAKGKAVKDLTDDVVDALESVDDKP